MNYGVIGVGGVFSNFQAESLLKVPELKLKALCDLNEALLKETVQKIPCDYFTPDYRDMLNDSTIDVIMVNTPQHLHLKICQEAASAKKHLYVEKPIATNVSDALGIIKAASSNDVKLCVGHQRRFIDVEMKAKELIQEGYLGKVHKARLNSSWWLDTTNEKRPWFLKMGNGGGGPMMRWGVHKTDTIRFLLADECERISAEWDHFVFHPEQGAVEDTLSAIFRMKSGTIVEIAVSNCQHEIPWYRGETIELWGDKGTLYYQPASGIMQLYSTAKEINPVTNHSFIELCYPSDGKEMIRIHQNFIESIKKNLPVPVSGEDGLRALEMVNGAYISGILNKKVLLPLTSELERGAGIG
jgi:myo-inositol 2-dehydrogenase/D-chiro-inositol 1-dehydrogenase